MNAIVTAIDMLIFVWGTLNPIETKVTFDFIPDGNATVSLHLILKYI